MEAISSLKNASGGGIVALNIDEEFEQLLPLLSEEESSSLRERLLRDGWDENEVIRLATWPGLDVPVILDGYNRYRICSSQTPPIEFKTTLLEFKSRDEAKVWMYEYQKSRRNWTVYTRVAIELLMVDTYAAVKKQAQRDSGKYDRNQVEQNSAQPDDEFEKLAPRRAPQTRDMVASAAGVSRDTVDRVKYIQNNANREDIADVMRGRSSINATYNKVRSANDPTFKAKAMPDEPDSEKEIDSFAVFSSVYEYNGRKATQISKLFFDSMNIDAQMIIDMTEPERTAAIQSVAATINYLNSVMEKLRRYAETSKDVMEVKDGI